MNIVSFANYEMIFFFVSESYKVDYNTLDL